MRKFIIKILLASNEQIVDKGLFKFEQLHNEYHAQLFADIYVRLVNYRRYCSTNALDSEKIESGKCFE